MLGDNRAALEGEAAAAACAIIVAINRGSKLLDVG